MLADHRDGLGWGNIEPRIPLLFPWSSVEILFEYLFSPRQSVTPTHEEELSHYTVVLKSSQLCFLLRVILSFSILPMRAMVHRACVLQGHSELPDQRDSSVDSDEEENYAAKE